MEFRTEIKLKPQQKNLIDHKSKILLLGSCFSENIGDKLDYYKIPTVINPFGTLFNPLTIFKVIEDSVLKKKYTEKELVKNGPLYHSLNHHSSFSALKSNLTLDNIHKAQEKCLLHLKSCSHLLITLGTSYVYQHLKSQNFVANCHKIPSNEFKKQLLQIEDIEISLQKTIEIIHKINPKCQIIFTISPVRHTKDGLAENTLSKAHLLAATRKTIQFYSNTAYFESYEIMMDDLRDYRFYKADMIHPNLTAINYIWQQFSKVWISEKATLYFKSINSIQQALLHKPFNAESESHQFFLKKLLLKKEELKKHLNITF